MPGNGKGKARDESAFAGAGWDEQALFNELRDNHPEEVCVHTYIRKTGIKMGHSRQAQTGGRIGPWGIIEKPEAAIYRKREINS